MDIFQAVILAIVQGLTEFLPVSSSAHLILVPELLGWQTDGLVFDVAVHVGTLLAVVMYLRKEIGQVVPAWIGGWRGLTWSVDGQLGWWMIVATIPVGLLGLFAGDYIEQNLRSVLIIVAATLIFGLLLGWVDRTGDSNQKEIHNLSIGQSLIIGLAQAIALIPGTSRSGITMTALLALGYSRVSAAKFSFLLSIPVIALAGMLKVSELLAGDLPVEWDILLVGVAVSAGVAFLCIHWFINLIQRIGMLPFVVYRVVLAIVIVVLLL